jgi:hypothetical protein
MPGNKELLQLVGETLARCVLRMEVQRKSRASVVATSPANTANTPCSEENYDATRV